MNSVESLPSHKTVEFDLLEQVESVGMEMIDQKYMHWSYVC